MKLRMGATLQNGKYQLNQILGHESLGSTYLATQVLLKQPVVIKTLDPSLQVTQSFPQLQTRFTEAIRLLARCQHPSLVKVLDFFQEDQLPFLVMDYIPGQTLYDRTSTPGAPPLTEAEAIHYTRQIASALSVAHRAGLVHHNIRPESIIRRQGTNLGILVGFGLAHDAASPTLLQSNPFAPADPHWRRDNRFAIDLYCLAATLYYLLSGKIPQTVPSLESEAWSPATKQAIVRGLSRDPQGQVQTVDEWLRLLPNTMLPLISPNTPQNNRVPVSPLSSHTSERRSPTPEVLLPTIPVAKLTPPGSPATNSIPTAAAHLAATHPSFVNTASLAAPVQATLIKPTHHLPKFLLVVTAVAGVIGLGLGVALRIGAAKAPGTSIFQPVQPFAEKGWKGTVNPTENVIDAPTESSRANSSTMPQRISDPEVDRVDRPVDIPAPKAQIQQSDSVAPLQPSTSRSLSEAVAPTAITPEPVQPTPEPIPTVPIAEPLVAPAEVAPPAATPVPSTAPLAPTQPSPRDLESPVQPRSNGRE